MNRKYTTTETSELIIKRFKLTDGGKTIEGLKLSECNDFDIEAKPYTIANNFSIYTNFNTNELYIFTTEKNYKRAKQQLIDCILEINKLDKENKNEV